MKKLTKSAFLSLAFVSVTLSTSYAEPIVEVAPSTDEKVAKVAKKDTAESLTDEMIVKMNVLVDALTSATDKASAEASAAKISKLSEDFSTMVKRFEKVEKPNEKEQKALTEKMTKSHKVMEQKMQGAMINLVSNQEAAAIIMPAMMEFAQKMAKHNDILGQFGGKK